MKKTNNLKYATCSTVTDLLSHLKLSYTNDHAITQIWIFNFTEPIINAFATISHWNGITRKSVHSCVIIVHHYIYCYASISEFLQSMLKLEVMGGTF